MRVALFGGSFNPPHVGHQMAALAVLETAPVDALWFIPCYRHPFDKPLAPFEDRLAMCDAAAAALGERVRVDPIEQTLPGKSRTVVTIDALQRAHPEHAFSLVVGSDLLADLDSWYGIERIREMVDFVVIRREGNGAAPGVAIPNVSSTEIRERLARGDDVRSLVPARVLDIIRARHLYGA